MIHSQGNKLPPGVLQHLLKTKARTMALSFGPSAQIKAQPRLLAGRRPTCLQFPEAVLLSRYLARLRSLAPRPSLQLGSQISAEKRWKTANEEANLPGGGAFQKGEIACIMRNRRRGVLLRGCCREL